MFQILSSIAPIFLLILLGNLLYRRGIPSVEFWNLNDKLVYWVLFPALLFYKTSTLDLSASLISDYAIVLVGGFFVVLLYALINIRLFRFGGRIASSMLQGTSRHNSFMAMAIAEKILGAEGLALAALAISFLVPLTNISVVSLMVVQLGKADGRNLPKAILYDLVRNPILIAIAIGLSVNSLNVGELPIIHDMTRLLGAAALPIVLLCIGANINFSAFNAAWTPTIISIIGKLVIFPCVILFLAIQLELSEVQTWVALIFGAAPTAASSYTLAKQMGGDAQLMAGIITLQTFLSFLTIPLVLTIAQTFFLE